MASPVALISNAMWRPKLFTKPEGSGDKRSFLHETSAYRHQRLSCVVPPEAGPLRMRSFN